MKGQRGILYKKLRQCVIKRELGLRTMVDAIVRLMMKEGEIREVPTLLSSC